MDNKKRNILIAIVIILVIVVVFVVFGLLGENNPEVPQNENTTIEDSIPEPENLETRNDNPTEVLSTPAE